VNYHGVASSSTGIIGAHGKLVSDEVGRKFTENRYRSFLPVFAEKCACTNGREQNNSGCGLRNTYSVIAMFVSRLFSGSLAIEATLVRKKLLRGYLRAIKRK
jgi:hypothetical protein